MKLLKGGRLFTVSHGILEYTDILIKDETIFKIEENIIPSSETEIIDICGKRVYPGLIDCHTHLGLDEEGDWEYKNELNEMGDPITPQLRAIDGFYPKDRAIKEAVSAGITTVITTTGSIQTISGQAAAIKLIPDSHVSEMLLDPCVGIKGGLGENPKYFYQKMQKMPTSRMGSAYLIRQILSDTIAYQKGWQPREYGKSFWNQKEKLKVLNLLFDKKIPWRVHAHRDYDILTALRIAREFDINVVIEHATEAPLIVDELINSKAGVVIGPVGFTVSKKTEADYPILENLNVLVQRGIRFAFCTDHPIISLSHLPQAVAQAIHYGLSEEKALQAITINAAEILGMPDRIGSIDIGKDADLIIADGSIFDFNTSIKMVLVNGNVVVKKKYLSKNIQ